MIKLFILIVVIINLFWSTSSFALDYAWAAPLYIGDGKCSVVIWINDVKKARKIEYNGKLIDNNYCLVEIQNDVFEKDFKYCVLSGIKVTSSNQPYFADFGGGPAGDRQKYWFEWGKAINVFPTFYCLLSNKSP